MKIEADLIVHALIHKLKHGYKTLSHVKWVSVSGVHISLASLLGIAGLVLAIRDGKMGNFNSLPWSSDRDSSSEKLWVVPGLQNLGNNCFLNVILQALASCLSFERFLDKIIEECESSFVEERIESLPLTVALGALLKELCMIRDGRIVLSPRKVMLAMGLYLPNFNLMSQQDAAEAFLHLLSSLREEFSECYVPNQSSLADVSAFPNQRILNPKRRGDRSEQKRWQQHLLGPFDGILGSILSCQSCSSQECVLFGLKSPHWVGFQFGRRRSPNWDHFLAFAPSIRMDFEFFHNLPLSPVLSSGGTIMPGCTVEDCLKQFIVAERVENYHCSRCWHIAAMKYLSSVEGHETKIVELRGCSDQDSCDCRSLFRLEELPWSNSFSRTFKQLSIARCPKILCIHLQRASINEFGELIKLQGHVSFPLVLNLFPFMKSGIGIRNWEEVLQRGQAKQQYQQPVPRPNHFNIPFDTRMLNCIYGLTGEGVYSESLASEKLGCTEYKCSGNTYAQAFQAEPSLFQTEGCSDTTQEHLRMQPDDKVSEICQLGPSNTIYHLVSVVEHFGRAGSGHYTVYRRVRTESDNEDHGGRFKSSLMRWFCISDSEVHSVSEKDVLAAEASLLFYERIVEGRES